MPTATRTRNSAGTRRRARRIQNDDSEIRAGSTPLVHEQAGDEESTEHEEQVDTQEPAGHHVGCEVVEDDREDGDAAQPVERPDVRQPGRVRTRHGLGRDRRRFNECLRHGRFPAADLPPRRA